MNQPWKVIIVLFGIFVAGGVTGGFVGLRVCKNTIMNRPVPDRGNTATSLDTRQRDLPAHLFAGNFIFSCAVRGAAYVPPWPGAMHGAGA